MRERALHPPPPAGEDSPSSSLQQAASSVVQYLHPSLATARPKAARFQGAEAQCVLIPTAAALRVAGACVKQCTLGCLSHLHKARITAARFCGHSGPLYGEKKQAVQPEEEAALRQRAASCARHCVAHCLTASSREALIRQAAQGFGAHAVHPSTDTSAVNDVNDDTFCPTGHTEDPGLETQPAEAPEMCASTSTLDAPEVSRRPSSSCNLPDAIMPKKEAAQPPASIRREEAAQQSTSGKGTAREKQKWIDSYKSLALQCSELSKELQYVAPKAVLPRWQRQALDLASYSAYVNLEATLRMLTMDVAKIRTSVSMMSVQACDDKIELRHARTYISEAIAQLKETLSEASLRLEQMQAEQTESIRQVTRAGSRASRVKL